MSDPLVVLSLIMAVRLVQSWSLTLKALSLLESEVEDWQGRLRLRLLQRIVQGEVLAVFEVCHMSTPVNVSRHPRPTSESPVY